LPAFVTGGLGAAPAAAGETEVNGAAANGFENGGADRFPLHRRRRRRHSGPRDGAPAGDGDNAPSE
jgi:hypothetical protein